MYERRRGRALAAIVLVMAVGSPLAARAADGQPVDTGLDQILAEVPNILGDVTNADPGAVPTVLQELLAGFLGADIIGGGDVGEDGRIGPGDNVAGGLLSSVGGLLHVGSIGELLAGRS